MIFRSCSSSSTSALRLSEPSRSRIAPVAHLLELLLEHRQVNLDSAQAPSGPSFTVNSVLPRLLPLDLNSSLA
jgi:hypothetical protein